MASGICTVKVEAELVAVVEDLVTLRSQAMFYLVFRDLFGNVMADGTMLLEFADED